MRHHGTTGGRGRATARHTSLASLELPSGREQTLYSTAATLGPCWLYPLRLGRGDEQGTARKGLHRAENGTSAAAADERPWLGDAGELRPSSVPGTCLERCFS
jgi:hypothetical protein